MISTFRVERHGRTILWLRKMGIESDGMVRPEIQQAALHLLPLPPVVIDHTTRKVVYGADVVTSLYAYTSENRFEARRVEETQLTIYEVQLRNAQDWVNLAEWLECFK